MLLHVPAAVRAAGNNNSNNNAHNWNNNSSWTNLHKPTSTEVAVVGNNNTITLDTLEGAAGLDFTSGVLNLVSTGDLTLSGASGAGASTWTGGDFTGSGRVKFDKGANISGANTRAYGGANLDFTDASAWTASNIQTGGSSTKLTNKSGGTFTTNFDGTIQNNLGGGTANFTNDGIFVKNGGTGNTEIQTSFTNGGTVNANSGRLVFSGGGQSTGTVSVGDNSFLRLTSSAFDFESGATINSTSTGAVEVSGSTTNFKGVNGNARYKVNGGTASLTSTNNTTGEFALESGAVNGTGKFNVGTFKWTGGDVSGNGGEIESGGGEISGSNTRAYNAAKLTFGGTTNWNGSNIQTGGSSTALKNKAGATFNATFDGTIQNNLGGGRANFTNEGTFNKNGGTGNSQVETTFTNTGTVNGSSGRLTFSGGGSSTGTVAVGNGSFVRFTGSNFDFESGATINSTGDGTVEVTGATTSFRGVNGNGRVKVNGGTASLTSTNNTTGEFALESGAVNGTGKFNVGTFKWTGGDVSGNGGEIESGGGEISGSNTRAYNAAKLTFGGTTNWNGSNIQTGGSSTALKNKAGATFNATFDGTIQNNLGGGTANFNNEGNFNKNGGSGDTDVQTSFTNTGTIGVSSGRLKLTGGGSSSGNVSLSNGALFRIGSTAFNFTDGAGIDGNGEFELDSTVNFAGNTHGSAKHKLVGGSAVFNGTHTVTGNFDVTGGTLTGLGNVVVQALLNWTGGDLTNGVVVRGNGGGNIGNGGNTRIYGGSTLDLDGTTHWTGNNIQTGGSSTGITNKLNGVFSAEFDGVIQNNLGGGTARFTNHGQFNKNGGAGDTDVQTAFDNDGNVNVNTGRLKLTGGGSGNGGFHIGNGAFLKLASNAYTFNSGTAIDGDGALEFESGSHSFNGTTGGNARHKMNGGNATFNGNHTSGRFDMNGGSIHGNGNLGIGNDFNWTNGDLVGLTVTSNQGANIAGGTTRIYGGGKLNLHGNTAWTAGAIQTGGSTTEIVNKNNGHFSATFDGAVQNNLGGGTATLTNNGEFAKTAGSGTTDVQINFVNNNGFIHADSGTLRFSSTFTQTAGTISVLNNATLKFDSGLNLAAGTLNGSGTVIGNVSVHGVLSPGSSPGQMNILGDLSLTSLSALVLEIGGRAQGSTYDFLNVSGHGALAGNLHVNFANGFNSGVLNSDSFTVLTTGTGLSGNFGNLVSGRIFTADGIGSFLLTTGASSLTLSDFQAIPEPGTWALLLGGIPLVVRVIRRRRGSL